MTRIDEIRARLDKATPGPWTVNSETGSNEFCDYTVYGIEGVCDANWASDDSPAFAYCDGMTAEDADFIAHAPEDIRRLLDTLDQIRNVLGEEPDPCPEHPDDDPITCGWKRDILTIRHILNDTKEN